MALLYINRTTMILQIQSSKHSIGANAAQHNHTQHLSYSLHDSTRTPYIVVLSVHPEVLYMMPPVRSTCSTTQSHTTPTRQYTNTVYSGAQCLPGSALYDATGSEHQRIVWALPKNALYKNVLLLFVNTFV